MPDDRHTPAQEALLAGSRLVGEGTPVIQGHQALPIGSAEEEGAQQVGLLLAKCSITSATDPLTKTESHVTPNFKGLGGVIQLCVQAEEEMGSRETSWSRFAQDSPGLSTENPNSGNALHPGETSTVGHPNVSISLCSLGEKLSSFFFVS